MQIIPTDNYRNTNIYSLESSFAFNDFSSTLNQEIQNDIDNARDLQKKSEEKDEEYRRNMRRASESFTSETFLEDLISSSPYSGSSNTAFSPFAPEPVRFTPSELEGLADNLLKDGASIDAVNAIKTMAGKVGGPNVEELTRAVEESLRGNRNSLSDKEITTLQEFSKRISPENPDKLYDSIRHGSSQKGVDDLVKAFAQISNLDQAKMSNEEILAIGKALDLNADTIKGLQEKLANLNKTSLSGKDVESLFADAKAEMQSKLDIAEKTMASYEKNIDEVVYTAEKREALARESQSRESKSVAQTRILMEDMSTTKALGDSLNRSENAANKNSKDHDVQAETNKAHENAHNANKSKMTFQEMERNSIATALASATKVRENVEADRETVQETNEANQFLDDKVLDKKTADLFFEKVEISLNKDSGSNTQNNFAHGNPSDSGSQNNPNNSNNGQNKQSSSNTQNLRYDVALASASQVQTSASSYVQNISASSAVETGNLFRYATEVRDQVQASMTEMANAQRGANGTQRIEVSLNPLELGQLNLSLSIKNGEVNATIQAEKAESAHMITAQLESIRAELENQGFKVESIDVEVGLSEDRSFAEKHFSGQEWQGMQEHNARRGQSDEMIYLEQLQTLSKLAAIDKASNVVLARNMQGNSSALSHSANNSMNNSMTGVHIIA